MIDPRYPFGEHSRAAELKAINLATDEARKVLRPGDRITYTACPGTKRWGVFVGFDGNWICTKSRSDICSINISKVNGQAVDFVAASQLTKSNGKS